MTIINRYHKFIFLKSRKTAGSSLELHLIKNTALGGDIYRTAWEAPRHGLPPRRRDSVVGLFNHYAYFNTHPFLRTHLPRVRQHHSARGVKSLVGSEHWQSALKVCGVRNPWDLMLSYWRWISRGAGGRHDPLEVSFEPWARAAISGDVDEMGETPRFDAKKLLHNFLFVDGAVVPQFLIRFENLKSDVQELSSLIGVEIPPLEIHEKASQSVDYRRYYSPRLAYEVGDFFSDVLDLTKYSY